MTAPDRRRPVAVSMFPELAPDRPTGPVFGSVQAGTNADLIALVAPLYLNGRVLDVTYGKGKWWDRFTPEDFTWHDKGIDGVDFRHLPHADCDFDAVTFDPPYVPAGGVRTSGRTAGEANFAARYGIGSDQQDAPRNRAALAVFSRDVVVTSRDRETSGPDGQEEAR